MCLKTCKLKPPDICFEDPVVCRTTKARTHTRCSPLAPDVNASIEGATGLLPARSLHCRMGQWTPHPDRRPPTRLPSRTPQAPHAPTQPNCTQACRQRTAAAMLGGQIEAHTCCSGRGVPLSTYPCSCCLRLRAVNNDSFHHFYVRQLFPPSID